MKSRMLTSLIAGAAILFLAADAAKEKKDDKDQLQGGWQAVGIEAGGQDLGEDAAKMLDMTITIKGDKYKAKSTREDEEGTITLDAKKDPKTIDFNIETGNDKDKKQLGIYTLDGDTWRICIGRPGGERPKEMKSTAENGIAVITFKRKKS